MSGVDPADSGQGGLLRGVEQYPRNVGSRDPWPAGRRAAYIQALEDLQRAGKLSRKELERTLIERGEAEARYGVRQPASRHDYELYPRTNDARPADGPNGDR